MGNLFEISSDSGRSKYATMQQGSTADMLLYSDQTVGSQWYDTTLQKVWTWSNLNVWHVVGETTIFVKPSVEMFEGQLVVPETNNDTVEIASTIADNQVMGVVVWDVTDGDEYVVIAHSGRWNVLCSDDSNPYTVGMFLVHDGSPTAEDGQAKERTSGNGHMAICMENGSVATGGGLLRCQLQTTERY